MRLSLRCSFVKVLLPNDHSTLLYSRSVGQWLAIVVAQLHVKYPTSTHYYRQLSAYFMFPTISPSIHRGSALSASAENHMSVHPSRAHFLLATNNYRGEPGDLYILFYSVILVYAGNYFYYTEERTQWAGHWPTERVMSGDEKSRHQEQNFTLSQLAGQQSTRHHEICRVFSTQLRLIN